MKSTPLIAIWQHPCRKYPFLATLTATLRYIEPLFFSAAKDLGLEVCFSDRELEVLFIVSWVIAKRDLNLVPDWERHPPNTGRKNIMYSDWFTTPLLNHHARLINSLTLQTPNPPTLQFEYSAATARARVNLSTGQGILPRERVWERASVAFRRGAFDQAYCTLKRGFHAARCREREAFFLRLAGLMLCLVKVHSEYESALRRAEQPGDWDVLQHFAYKYEGSSIPLLQRYVDEALTYMTIGKPEDSVEAFRLFRRMLHICPHNSWAGPHAMQYCLGRRTHFKLAQKIYPTLRRMDDTDVLRAGFRKWSREMTSNARN